jgi:tetrahydromethanopterin S-methyltransferase subunit B
MGKWSAILRAGKYVVDNPATRSVGRAVTSPARSLATSGAALKTATIGAGVGYVGWQALVNDKPVARTVADVAIGEKNVDTIVGKTSDIADSTGEAISNVSNSASNANSALNGISDFMRNVSGGEGGNMFGNLFSNIFSGNVSGLSIVGLLAAGLMIFSHTGWLGKIGGALLAMALIGNNSKRVVTPQISTETQQSSGLRR